MVANLFRFVKVDVYLGAHNFGASSEQYRVKYTSTNFTKHPSWRAGSTANNIGLIKLPSTISFTSKLFNHIYKLSNSKSI